MPPSRVGLPIALALVAVVAFGLRWRASDVDLPLGTDEADYVRAMAYGPAATYFGTHEQSGVTFLRSVLSEYRATGWARPFKRDWESGDAAGLRHYHPPVGLYPVSVLLAAGITDERSLRKVPAALSALACVATAWLAWALLASLPVVPRTAAAATAGLLATLSPFHAQNGMEVGFHAAFTLCSTVALAGLVAFDLSGDRRWWRAAWAATAMSMLTLPYWVLLLPPLAWVAWSRRYQLSASRLALEAAASLLITLVVVWPPFLLRAAVVKTVLMYGGILIRPLTGAPHTWLVMPSPAHVVIVTLLAVLAIAVLVSRNARLAAHPAVPVALFVIGFAVLNLRVMHMKPLYAGDVIAAASALGVVAFLLVPARAGVATVLAPLMLLLLAITEHPTPSHEWRGAMAVVEARLAGRRVLVTPRAAGSIIVYYLPRSQVLLDSSDPADLLELRRRLAGGDVDALLQLGAMPESGGVGQSVRPVSAPSGDVIAGPLHMTWWDIR